MKSAGADARAAIRTPSARDMDASAFSRILEELIGRVPGAYACALVDQLGETVDYAGTCDPFDVKIAAAHLQILLDQVARWAVLGEPRSVVVRGQQRSFVARQLPDGYALVVLLRRRAGFSASRRAFAACERALAIEAGWPLSIEEAIWHPTSVETDRRGRPAVIGPERLRVEVLGSVQGLPAFERGFRVRTADGSELTLVREPKRAWYSDEALEDLKPDPARPRR